MPLRADEVEHSIRFGKVNRPRLAVSCPLRIPPSAIISGHAFPGIMLYVTSVLEKASCPSLGSTATRQESADWS
jgi:hypothetical protein